jgi:hypothetical protein
MAIGQEEKLHGVAILRLLEEISKRFPDARFGLLTGESRSSYILKGRLLKEKKHLLGSKQKVVEFAAGIFLKTSMKRASPWGYSFTRENQDEVQSLKNKYGQVFLIFVNGDDGIACIDFNSSKQVLDENHEENEWLRISRKPRQAYRITGNDGAMNSTLSINSFPRVISHYFEKLIINAPT